MKIFVFILSILLFSSTVNADMLTLTWNHSIGNTELCGFRAERRGSNDANWTVAGYSNFNVKTFVDIGLTHNETYRYRVFAFNRNGESVPSNEATGIAVNPDPTPPVVNPGDLPSDVIAPCFYVTQQ